ncbi:carbohydrate esterase family 9 protein [Penicillium argentinense]|uniref:N-acetylglucosamine-6-phosphate deacetylase n=1 Tax=Penicillium argentinense TaxID=1131581 RepID=A0A9W9G3Q9_9EURO|nr:carbohydrate esterase family 9 protein [Penicillium argentinense]KAJ5111581.1 carbohydrate esterase family 9 protein [Penicillium argentinense]
MSHLIHLVNARLVDGDQLVSKSLWIDSIAGVFIPPPLPDPASSVAAATSIDLQGRIVSPGFIDLQINGAYGFDFSEDATEEVEGKSYTQRYRDVRRKLIATGTTSFLPTMTSQLPQRYHRNLPLLGPSKSRDPFDGAESLGAHCEGPFFAHNRMGVHLPDAIISSGKTSEPTHVFETYGMNNLFDESYSFDGSISSNVRMITMAPERPGALDTITELSQKGIVMCIGHMAADYKQARAGIEVGATMITHLYNQMNPLHHRGPGPLGILGGAGDINPETEAKILGEGTSNTRPYFGIIADGHHVHPASVRLAHLMHPDGLILVTDALLLLGDEDGTIDWLTRRLTKKGISVTLEGTDIIAGSCVTLLQCINNFRKWTGASIPATLQAVTSRPAAVLKLGHVKGTLQAGADADFVVLSENHVPGQPASDLVVDEVWNFGTKVFDRNTS